MDELKASEGTIWVARTQLRVRNSRHIAGEKQEGQNKTAYTLLCPHLLLSIARFQLLFYCMVFHRRGCSERCHWTWCNQSHECERIVSAAQPDRMQAVQHLRGNTLYGTTRQLQTVQHLHLASLYLDQPIH